MLHANAPDASRAAPGGVALREVSPDDLPVFFEQQLDVAANRMAAFGAADPADRAAFMAKWEKILADTSNTTRTIVNDGAVAGFVSVFRAPWSGQMEVSYWIGSAFWGRGVATRALRTLLQSVTTRPLHARVARDNVASLRVLEKCGFVVAGTDRAFAPARGAEVDEIVLVLDMAHPTT